jgi:antitoxin component YwqK of YwqJK toxin-antitoxin module
MKLKLVISVLIIVFLVSCSKSTKKTYWENGQLKSEMSYKDDKLNGVAVWYYENGEKELEAHYKDNVLDGPLLRWYENGLPEVESYYEDGLLQGRAVTYNGFGKLVLEENYRNDTLDGKYYKFYDDGAPQIAGAYADGMFDGRWIYYNNHGKIVGMGEFDHGSGTQKAWWPNGQIKREVTYVNNLKNGAERWYNQDGELEKVVYYEDGEEIQIP